MTADDARANVQAWRNNQAQKAMLEIELNDDLRTLFDYFFGQIEKQSMSGFNSFNFRERIVMEKFKGFNIDKVKKLFTQLGFYVTRDWDSYDNEWCWFIRW